MPTWEIVFNPRIDVHDRELLSLVVQIEAYKLSILKIPLPPGFRQRINRLNIIRQIKGTTGIEGNTLEEEKIATLIPDSHNDKKDFQDVTLEEREVLNAYKVITFVSEELNKTKPLIITEDLIRELHALNTVDCDYKGNVPGQYRNCQVTAGEYMPPPHSKVPELMAQFVEFINSREVIDGYGPLIRAILAHFYLISIHPFVDGNGRTSRALEACILYHGGYNIHGFYSLANYFYKNRNEYIKRLQEARFKYNGDLNDFVKFSLRGFLSEMEHVQEEILMFVRRVLFRDYVMELFKKDRVNWRIMNLLEYLITDRPYISIDEFRTKRHHLVEAIYKKYKGSKTLQRDLKTMLELKLIKIKEEKIYPNFEILDVLTFASPVI
jgi:Fic family protein